jgi:hypothetical protein
MPPFLVCYDMPRMSGLWAVVEAPSAEAITAKYPEVVVVTERPPWMSEDDYQRMRDDPLWLDEEVPSGIFHVVVTDRART